MNKAFICAAAALALLCLYLERGNADLKRQRDAAVEQAVTLRLAVTGHEEAVRALEEQAAVDAALLVSLMRQHNQIEEDYARKQEQSDAAKAEDPDFAVWSATPLPVRLHAGGGLLGNGGLLGDGRLLGQGSATGSRAGSGGDDAPGRADGADAVPKLAW